jgi:hypothetical protein
MQLKFTFDIIALKLLLLETNLACGENLIKVMQFQTFILSLIKICFNYHFFSFGDNFLLLAFCRPVAYFNQDFKLSKKLQKVLLER